MRSAARRAADAGSARRLNRHRSRNQCGDHCGIASIDTAPFFFPKEKSPGGREWDYHNNAESFLLIGEAMGKEMLELRKGR